MGERPTAHRACRSPYRGKGLNGEDDLLRENQALRERLSRLSAASLQVSESLVLDEVLHEVIDNVRLRILGHTKPNCTLDLREV